MSNLTIHRPIHQPFVQYPHWIAQAKEFSLDEAGLLSIILSFKDYLSKSSLVNFTRDGKRAIDTAWKGLIQKGILVVKSFKSEENRFAWSYTVNLEKVALVSPQKTVVNYAEIAHKYGVSEEIARAITEEAIARAIPAASLPNIPIESIPTLEPVESDKKESKIGISTPEIASQPSFEVSSMLLFIPEIDFNPFFEVQSMPIPLLEMGSKTIIETPEMPTLTTEMGSKTIIEPPKMPTLTTEMGSKTIIETPKMPTLTTEMGSKPNIEMPILAMERTPKSLQDSTLIEKEIQTAHEKRNKFAEDLLNDKKLRDYLRTESPLFEVTLEILNAFHKRLDMNQLEHPNYEKYAQHFRNWLPDFLKYKEVGDKIKASKPPVAKDENWLNEKCGTNKDFNILRKKLQNPQADYMTYQGWVLQLAEIAENLSPADITYKKEMIFLYQNGQLLQRFQERKAQMESSQGSS
jgi:hypothetical protein